MRLGLGTGIAPPDPTLIPTTPGTPLPHPGACYTVYSALAAVYGGANMVVGSNPSTNSL